MKKQRKCSSILSLEDMIMIFRGSLAKKTTKRPNRSRSSTWDPQGVKSFVHNLLHEELNILENLHLSHWEKNLNYSLGRNGPNTERSCRRKAFGDGQGLEATIPVARVEVKLLSKDTKPKHPLVNGWWNTKKREKESFQSEKGSKPLNDSSKATKWFLKGDCCYNWGTWVERLSPNNLSSQKCLSLSPSTCLTNLKRIGSSIKLASPGFWYDIKLDIRSDMCLRLILRLEI